MYNPLLIPLLILLAVILAIAISLIIRKAARKKRGDAEYTDARTCAHDPEQSISSQPLHLPKNSSMNRGTNINLNDLN